LSEFSGVPSIFEYTSVKEIPLRGLLLAESTGIESRGMVECSQGCVSLRMERSIDRKPVLENPLVTHWFGVLVDEGQKTF